MKLQSLFLVFLLLSAPVFSSPLPDFPFITVTGRANAELPPDKAILTFNVTKYDKNPQKALQRLGRNAAELLKMLKQHGIKKDQVESYHINKSADRKRDENYPYLPATGPVIGYQFVQSFKVYLDDISGYSKIMAALMSMKNVSQLLPEFDIDTRIEVEEELMAKAGADARHKAQLMAKGLGVRLLSVYAISADDLSLSSFFTRFGLKEKYALELAAAKAMKADFADEILFVPKTIRVSKSVNVVYKIEASALND